MHRSVPWGLVAVLLLAGCGGGHGGSTAPAPATYSVIANVSGLSGSGLVLSLANGAAITVNANGQVPLANGLKEGAAYSVAVQTQPPSPLQTCAISNPSGSISGANVTISVSCVAGSVNTIDTTLAYDSSVPPSVQSKITRLVSASATVSPGAALTIPVTLTNTDAFVLALDANGDILAAAMTNSPATTLTASSTAIALTRLIVGTPSGSLTSGQLNAAIEKTAGFPNLVAAIRAAYSLGTALASSATIYDDLSTIASELPASVLLNISSVRSKEIKSLATPVITSVPPPYEVLTWRSGTDQSVFVTGADTAVTGVDLVNAMGMNWWVSSTDPSGVDLSKGVELPRSGLLTGPLINSSNQTLASIVAALNNVALAGNGAAFNIRLSQNSTTQLSNVKNVASDVLEILLPLSQGCVQEIIEAVVAGTEPPDTFGAVVSYLTSVVPGIVGNVVLPSKCTVAAGKLALGDLTAGGFKFLTSNIVTTPGSVIYKGVQVGNLLVEIAELAKFWSYGAAGPTSRQVGVCEGISGPTSLIGLILHITGIQIAACATDLQFTVNDQPAAYFMAPGAQNDSPPIVAATANGASTLVPDDVVYSTSSPSIVDVNAVDEVNVSGSAPLDLNVATITGKSPSTGASGTYLVTVLKPTVTPATLQTQGGAPAFQLQLTDGLKDVVAVPANAYWLSSDTQGQSLIPTTGVDSLSGHLFEGKSTSYWGAPQNAIADTVTITAYDPTGEVYASATITVTAILPTTTTLTPNPSTLPTTGGSVTFTAAITANSTAPPGTPAPTGTVTFTDSTGTAICPEPVPVAAGAASCVAAISSPPATVTASYSGDANYAMSSAQTTVTLSSVSAWIGTWDGNIISTCGAITGPFDIEIQSAGGNQLSLTDNYGDAYSLTISSTNPNAATSSLNGGIYYAISGTSMTVSEPSACQTGTLTKQ